MAVILCDQCGDHEAVCPVYIVRCKHCQWWNEHSENIGGTSDMRKCILHDTHMKANDFCSYGKRIRK